MQAVKPRGRRQRPLSVKHEGQMDDNEYTHSPPTPIPATEVGSFFASIWPATVVVAHYFEQIFVYFQKKKCVFGREMATLSLKSSAPKSGFDTYLQ